ncbi:MAG: ATP-dependent Clp protease ATP-binding subunit, partial [Micavibrio aeruginosavorus]|nr:ATP-dependent Clp protease ATP-binding subunit [Micavibrio aeruginosavorus]
MKKNGVDVACVYVATNGALAVVDCEGRKLPYGSTLLGDGSAESVTAEKDRLLRTEGFVAIDPEFLIHPGHVAAIGRTPSSGGSETISFLAGSGKSLIDLEAPSSAFVTAMLADLEDKNLYLRIPGDSHAVGTSHLKDVSFDGKSGKLAFTLSGGSAYESEALSVNAAIALLDQYKSRNLPVTPVSGTAFQSALDRLKKTGVPNEGANDGNVDEDPAAGVKAAKEALRALNERISSNVIGQDHAAHILARAVRRNFAGLGEDNKPVGSFLFLGPTGVGKTETARQLAEALGCEFKKFDMSEYMEKHNVARLIGSPSGYVDNEKGGHLTNFVMQNPRCVILLDEVEKAHASVLDILLQITDDARLTDGRGKVADFRNAIVIMTSNIGATPQKQTSIGFTASIGGEQKVQQDDDGRNDPAVRAYFRPETINRLDAVIRFRQLSREDTAKIVDIFTAKLSQKLASKGVDLHITPEARSYLAEKGYSPEYGARPLKRVIQDEIADP